VRNVLFVLEPLGTGKAWRALAIAEQLKLLFPAIEPHFLAGPAAATLLRSQTKQPVEDTLAAVLPPRDSLTAEAAASGELARAAARASRRLAPAHAREALRVARAIQAELVVVDGLFGTPPLLARAGFPVAFLCDHLLDASPERGVARRAADSMARRSLVASSRLRFFVGEPSYLASPELRVWSRRFFRYTGPIAGLARLNHGECATLRDELGLGRKQLLVIAAGSGFAAPAFEAAIAAADLLARERAEAALRERASRSSNLVIKLFGGPELAVDDERTGKLDELCRWLAIADAAIVPGGLSLLSEAAGLGVPTLALPLPGHPLEQRQTDYFVNRFGVRRVDGPATPDAIAAALRKLLAKDASARPHDAPGPDEQRRNADFVADLLAEALGRKRPVARA
jgi:hypothetical protein